MDHDRFLQLATECPWPRAAEAPARLSPFTMAVRSVCAPVLDLPPHADLASYVERRAELGTAEAVRRLLRAGGIERLLIETGMEPPGIATPAEMSEVSGLPTSTVVRLETLMEAVAPGSSPARLVDDFEEVLDERLTSAVGVKTVAAYRCGLELPAAPPADTDVRKAAERWLRETRRTGRHRLTDRLLIGRAVWAAVDRGLVMQVHVGFGDPDVDLHRADPSFLMPFLHATRTTGARIALLHCFPYLSQAATLAHVFPHVWLDASCVSHFAGPSAPGLVRDALTVAPFDRVLFASDAYGLAEQYLVSAITWRRGLGVLLDEWLCDGWLAADDAHRVAGLIGADNARSLYGLTAA
jgi:hypothetical protein